MDGLVRQLRKYRQGAGFEAAENVLDQTAPLARDGVDQRPQFGGVLKVPQQFVIGAAMAEIAETPREPCGAPAEITPQHRRPCGRMHRGSREIRQQAHHPRRAVVERDIKLRHAVPRRKDARDRQAGVGGSEVEQGLRLQIGHRAVFRGVGNLQDIFAATQRAQPKVLIALTVEPVHGGDQAVVLGRQSLGQRFRDGGCGAQRIDRVSGNRRKRRVRH